MWRVTVGLLNSSTVSGASRPLALVASGVLCQALKFSICVQLTQAAVKPQGSPAARSFFADLGLGGAAAVIEALVLLRLGQIGDVAGDGRVVEFEHRVGAFEAVGLGGQRDVVPGAEILDLCPAHPGGGEAAGQPSRPQLFR